MKVETQAPATPNTAPAASVNGAEVTNEATAETVSAGGDEGSATEPLRAKLMSALDESGGIEVAEPAPDAPEEADEKSEPDEESEGEEDEQEEEPEGQPKDEEKETKSQRQKRKVRERIEAAESQAKQANDRLTEANTMLVETLNDVDAYEAQLVSVSAQRDALLEVLRSRGFELSPTERELVELRGLKAQSQLGKEVQQSLAETQRAQQQQTKAQRDTQLRQMAAEIKTASSFAGVSAQDLARAVLPLERSGRLEAAGGVVGVAKWMSEQAKPAATSNESTTQPKVPTPPRVVSTNDTSTRSYPKTMAGLRQKWLDDPTIGT